MFDYALRTLLCENSLRLYSIHRSRSRNMSYQKNYILYGIRLSNLHAIVFTHYVHCDILMCVCARTRTHGK